MLFKNVSGQKIHIYAYDSTTGAAKTGDAANITAYVSLDGTANAIDDTNPAEVDATNMPGVYVFDLTQAETNCNAFALYAKSSTSNIRIEPIIGFTTGAAVTQTGDSYAIANNGTYGLSALKTLIDAIDALADAIKAKTDNLPASPAAVGSAMALTAAYDAAKTAGTSTLTAQQVWEYATRTLTAFGFNVTVGTNNDKTGYALPPTAAEIKTALEAAGGHLALILEDTGITLPSALSTIAGYIDTEITQIINAIAALPTTEPDNATIGAINTAVAHATYGLAALKALIDTKSSHSPADVKTALEADGSKLDHLWEMTEDDGGTRRFTVNALEMAPAGEGGSAAPTVEDIDTRLSATHGAGAWGANASVVLPVMQGKVYTATAVQGQEKVYTATAVQGQEVVVVQGDTPRIYFDLDDDYTGWQPRFGAKAALGDADYVIGPKDGTWTTASGGEGYVDLTALETAMRGRYFAEIELQNGAQRLTAMRFYLKIIDAVIKE